MDPVLRVEGTGHLAVRRGYVCDVARQLALRLNRTNEATSCWSWADSIHVPDAVVPATPVCGYSHTAGRRAVITANAWAAQWRPRERQDGLFKLFKEDEP